MAANAQSSDRRFLVELTPALKKQLWFWLTMVKASSGHCRIPAPRRPLPAWALNFFTDSAGGSQDGSARGAGGVAGEWWFQVPWGSKINGGCRAEDGKKLGGKLSALELVGPLVCVAAGAHLCRGQPVNIWVDNAGSVQIWRKGYATTCQLSSCLVRAIACVADALDCRVELVKVRRCSDTGPELADLLSCSASLRNTRQRPAGLSCRFPPPYRRLSSAGSRTRQLMTSSDRKFSETWPRACLSLT